MRKLAAAGNAAAIAAIEAEPLAPLPEVYRQLPIYYITNRLIVGGPNSTVVWPRYSRVMDYELEFDVFIGRPGLICGAEPAIASSACNFQRLLGTRPASHGDARLARSRQREKLQWRQRDRRWIVTPDEVMDPYNLRMEARVNGEVWSSGVSSGMLFSFEEIIAHMSQDETVFAGEFLGSGTVDNGCGLEHGRFLQHGDTIQLEVERIGVLRNKVDVRTDG